MSRDPQAPQRAALARKVRQSLTKGRYVSSRLPRQCVYCGDDVKRGVDHVPPLAVVAEGFDGQAVTYPCCQPCNARLGAFPDACVVARALCLIERLQGYLEREFSVLENRRSSRFGACPYRQRRFDVDVDRFQRIGLRYSEALSGLCRCGSCEKRAGD